ncbi:MAG TPA: adenylate/guanylate cyclase domain-containing protein [Candidatus Limnocylindrales bacterium]|nr:adenylate/guanylate cyclase domain-containing protein [Candidatus Limnocylindrales bacterium]
MGDPAAGGRSQTRGFLFADLRGYSAFTERHGDQAARELLASYRLSVRKVIASFDGAEIRTEGDSFYVVFDSVGQAVRAGLAILAAVAEPSADTAAHPVLVGIGIHAGETEDSAEGIVSNAVNVAARICAQAEPGELLVSDTVRALTRSYLEVSFLPRGRRRLKGIAEPIALYRVAAGRASGTAARGNPFSSALSRGWLTRAGVTAAVAVAVLAIAIVAGTLWREGMARESPAPAGSGLATLGPSAQSSPGAATSVTTIQLGTDAAGGSGGQFGNGIGGSNRIQPVELSEGTYAFGRLRPRVTFAVRRPGWYASVDNVDAAELSIDEPSSPPGLQQAAAVQFGSVQVVYNDPCQLSDTAILDPTPDAFIEWLQGHPLLTTSAPSPVGIGGYSALEVDVSLTESGCHGARRVDLFPVADTRFYLSAGDRLRVIVISLPTRPLSILVQQTPAADDEIAAAVEQLLEGIEIDPS